MGALADCLLSWFPPEDEDDVNAKAAAFRVAEYITVMIGANTKR